LDEIGNVRLGDADVSTGKALNDARNEHPADRWREREHRPADRCADLADDEHFLTADAIADVSPYRAADELRERERRKQQSDDHVAGAEMFDEIRHQRNENGKSEDVDEGD